MVFITMGKVGEKKLRGALEEAEKKKEEHHIW